MLKALFGNNTLTRVLRGGLEETSATHRVVASRVANALETSGNVDFASDLGSARSRLERQEDLEADMAALADTQIRYEADAKLLQEAYGRLRTAMRDRA